MLSRTTEYALRLVVQLASQRELAKVLGGGRR